MAIKTTKQFKEKIDTAFETMKTRDGTRGDSPRGILHFPFSPRSPAEGCDLPL